MEELAPLGAEGHKSAVSCRQRLAVTLVSARPPDSISSCPLTFDISALTAVISQGRLTALRSGRCGITAVLAIQDANVLTRSEQLDLPEVISLQQGARLLPTTMAGWAETATAGCASSARGRHGLHGGGRQASVAGMGVPPFRACPEPGTHPGLHEVVERVGDDEAEPAQREVDTPGREGRRTAGAGVSHPASGRIAWAKHDGLPTFDNPARPPRRITQPKLVVADQADYLLLGSGTRIQQDIAAFTKSDT